MLKERIYLHSTNSNAAWDEDLGKCRNLISPPVPDTDFNSKVPSWKEILVVVKAATNNLAPGPYGIPFLVYKRCPKIILLPVEDPKGDLKKGEDCLTKEICGRGVDSKGREVNHHRAV